jgi:hypothetical protein
MKGKAFGLKNVVNFNSYRDRAIEQLKVNSYYGMQRTAKDYNGLQHNGITADCSGLEMIS